MPTPAVTLQHLQQRILDSLQEHLPHRAVRTGNPAWAGRWPDLTPEARLRLAGRVRDWSTELKTLAGDSTTPETFLLLDRLARLETQLEASPEPQELVSILGAGLRDLLVLPLASLTERTGALVQRLRALPTLSSQLQAHGPYTGDWQGHIAANFLLQLAQWLGEGAEQLVRESDESLALLRRETPAAREVLLEMARWFAPAGAPMPARLGAQGLLEHLSRETGRDIRLERLEKHLEKEWSRQLGQLEGLAVVLARRFGGGVTAGTPGKQLAEVLEQLALDSPRVEHWESYQQRQLTELHELTNRMELLPRTGPCPMLAPRTWAEPLDDWDWLPGMATHPGCLFSLDLAWLEGPAQQEFTRDRNTWAMQILLAREALPGRLWLMNHWQQHRPAARLLNRPSDGDGWALLAPELMLRHGWGQGETRLKLMLYRERLRDLAAALADLRWHAGDTSEDGVLAGLCQQGLMPPWLARLELERIRREPGRALLAIEKLEALRQLESRWKRAWGEQAGTGDLVDLLADCADLPIHWLRRHGENLVPAGRVIQEMPSPVELVRSQHKDELVASLEQQLASLGRIQREDLEAGMEFDLPGTGRPVDTADTLDALEEPAGDPTWPETDPVPQDSIEPGPEADEPA